MWNAAEAVARPVAFNEYKDLSPEEADERARALCQEVTNGATWHFIGGHLSILFQRTQPHPTIAKL